MISTTVKTHVILQHSGAVEYITSHQADLVINGLAVGAKGFKNAETGEWMTFSSISDVMSVEKYYEKYPAKRPEWSPELTLIEDEKPLTEKEQTEANERRNHGIAKGLRQFIAEAETKGENPLNAKAILNDFVTGKRKATELSKGYWIKAYEKYKDKEDRTESEEAHYQFAVKKMKEFKVFA